MYTCSLQRMVHLQVNTRVIISTLDGYTRSIGNCNVLATVNGGQCHPPNHAVRRAYPITPELAATPPGRAYALTTPQNQNVRQSPEFAVRNGWNQETLLRRLQPGSQLDDTPSPLTTRS